MMVALITNKPFNFSKLIYVGMKENVIKSAKDKFLQFPRFIQLIINDQYPNLPAEGPTSYAKSMTKQTLELQRAAKSNKKYVYEAGFEYTYFGFFAGDMGFALAEGEEAVNVGERAQETEVPLAKRSKKMSKPVGTKTVKPVITQEVLSDALEQAQIQAAIDLSVKDIPQKKVVIEERAEPASVSKPVPDFEKKKGVMTEEENVESSSSSGEVRRANLPEHLRPTRGAGPSSASKKVETEKEKDQDFDPLKELTESDDDSEQFRISKRKGKGLMKKTGGSQEPPLKKPKTFLGKSSQEFTMGSSSMPSVTEIANQAEMINNLKERLEKVEKDNVKKGRQIKDLLQTQVRLKKTMTLMLRMIRRLSTKVGGDGDDGDESDGDDNNNGDGNGKKDRDVIGEEGNKDVPKGKDVEAEGGEPASDVPEVVTGTKTNEGAEQSSISAPTEQPEVTPTIPEVIPETIPDVTVDDVVESPESDPELEQLFKEIDDVAVLSRPTYLSGDGTPIEGIEVNLNGEATGDREGASSAGVEKSDPTQEPTESTTAPPTSAVSGYRMMTREEKVIYFKSKAGDYLDLDVSAFAIFDEEIPCLPYGLSQKQKDLFTGKYAAWFKPKQHEKPVLGDLMMINFKRKNVDKQVRKGRKVTVKKDDSTIIAWWWDPVRKALGVKRESGFIEYFSTIVSIMNSLPEYELRRLARLNMQNPTNNDSANAALRILIKAVQDNFKGYDLVKGVRKVRKGETWEHIEYPVPKSLLEVNVQTHQPLGAFSNLTGWRYDGQGHFAVLEFGDGSEVIMFEPMDLTAYHIEDLKKISKMQIKTTPEYEFHGKSFHQIVEACIVKANPVTGYVLRSPPKKDTL